MRLRSFVVLLVVSGAVAMVLSRPGDRSSRRSHASGVDGPASHPRNGAQRVARRNRRARPIGCAAADRSPIHATRRRTTSCCPNTASAVSAEPRLHSPGGWDARFPERCFVHGTNCGGPRRPWFRRVKSCPVFGPLPSSMFLYPIGPARARLIGLRSRVERSAVASRPRPAGAGYFISASIPKTWSSRPSVLPARRHARKTDAGPQEGRRRES